MEEFWKWFLDWWPTICGACTSVVGAIAAAIVYYVRLKQKEEQNKILSARLDDARRRSTRTRCPRCGSEINFSELSFYLPGDIPDNDLNGVDDRIEK